MNPTASPDYSTTATTLGPGEHLGMVRKVQSSPIAKTAAGHYPPTQNGTGGSVMLVFNDSGGALAQGTLVAWKVDATNGRVRKIGTSEHPHVVCGVVIATSLDNNEYGWIGVDGCWQVLAGTGGVTKDKAVIVDATTAGTATDVAAATGAAFGVARETKASTNLFLCQLMPRSGATAALEF